MKLLRPALTAAALTTSAVIAAPLTASIASASATTTITLWQNGAIASSASYLPTAVSAFEAANPGIKIQLIAQPASNYFALLQASFISHTSPDIADLFAGSYNLPVEPYLTNLKSYIPARLLDSAKGTKYYALNNNIHDAVFGAPIADQFYNGFYNKALLKKAGVTSVPTDWKQLFAACTALQAHGIQPMAYSMSANGTHEDWSYLASALPLTQWNALLNDKLSYANPTLISQVQQWSLLYKDHCTNPDPVTSTNAQQVFATGKAAMYVGGSWLIPPFATLGHNLGVMVPPFSVKPQNTLVEMPGGGYGIPKSSPHAKVAAAFLTFLLSPKGQQIVTASGQPPVISKGVTATNPVMKQLVALAGSGAYVKYPMYDNFSQPSVSTGLNSELELAFMGQSSAKAALSNLERTQQALPASERNVNYGL